MLLGMAFGTPAYVSAQTRGLECSHEHTASAYSRTGQEGSYTYIVEKKVNGKNYYSEGINTSCKKDTSNGREVITTTVEKPKDAEVRGWGEGSKIFLVYKSKILSRKRSRVPR